MTGAGFQRGIRLTLVAGAFCCAFGLDAGAQHARAPGAPCQSAGSTNLQTQCFVGEARKADRELERVYRTLAKELKPEEFAKFWTAQNYWYTFRATDCEAEKALYEQESQASLEYAACAESDTRRRVEELKTIYAWLFR